MLILRVGNIYTDIIGELPAARWKEFERTLSFRPQNYQFTPAFNRFIYHNGKPTRRMWDGWKKQFWRGKKRTYFPTGLFAIAKNYLDSKGIPFVIEDIRERHNPNFDLTESGEFSYYPYQSEIIDHFQ